MSTSQELPLQSRRDFCVFACQAATAVAAGALLPAACGGNPNAPSNAPALSQLTGTVSGRVVSVVIDAAGPLGTIGGAALISSGLGNFLASRTSQDTVTVLTATCTHEACTVSGIDGAQYVCPCHGSRYSLSGTVQNGPAPSNLRQFASTLSNGTLTFSA